MLFYLSLMVGMKIVKLYFALLANKLTSFCHLIGKTLPPRWQTFAIGMAKFCQR